MSLGMLRRQAEAICPQVITLERDLGAETASFEEVVRAIEEVVPRVEMAEPGLAFVPVGGAIRYYGGEVPLTERITKELEAVAGPGWRMGLAAGPFAARRAAQIADPIHLVEDDAEFLAGIDLSAAAPEELTSTFRWLGVTTLGELARLPRPAILSRFGPAGLEVHRIASGEDRSPMPRLPPSDAVFEERFDPPLEALEQAGFAARSLAAQLVGALAPSGAAPHRVEVECESATGVVLNRTWRSMDPFDEATLAERMWWQLRAWTESGGVPGGLARLQVSPADLSDQGRQLALHEDAVSEAEVARSFARAQALLGPDAVLQAKPQGGRSPGERVQWYRWGEEPASNSRDPSAPWPGRTPEPSPALVPPEPPHLEVEWDAGVPTRVRLGSRWVPVLSWAGPWRLMGRWWEGGSHVDRYQLVTSAGAFLCEVQGDRTVLAGVYD